ncbi:MAG: hypothetical protein OEN50_06175 [Deltaproteobacteria bacterium]|nr:hypothetical protein [Deltaproteobacteria bacterium]
MKCKINQFSRMTLSPSSKNASAYYRRRFVSSIHMFLHSHAVTRGEAAHWAGSEEEGIEQ